MKDISEIVLDAVDLNAACSEVEAQLLGKEEWELQAKFASVIGADEPDDIDFKDPEVDHKYRSFVKNYARERVEEALSELPWSLQMDECGLISIWRSIAVPADWLQNGINERPLGIFWAYDRRAAEAHWGEFTEGKREIVLEARVALSEVDWHRSVYMNAISEEERELSLKSSAIVHLVSAAWQPMLDGTDCLMADEESLVELGIDLPAGEIAFEQYRPTNAKAF